MALLKKVFHGNRMESKQSVFKYAFFFGGGGKHFTDCVSSCQRAVPSEIMQCIWPTLGLKQVLETKFLFVCLYAEFPVLCCPAYPSILILEYGPIIQLCRPPSQEHIIKIFIIGYK